MPNDNGGREADIAREAQREANEARRRALADEERRRQDKESGNKSPYPYGNDGEGL